MEESRTSPRLIGISSPKTWDEWIKKEPQTLEAVAAQEEKEEVVTVEKIEIEQPAPDVQHQSLNTILEEDEDVKPSSNKTSSVKIKIGEEESPKVKIKTTRFQVIPTVDVWEPKSTTESSDEVVVGDPMTMIESRLNELTMVESQLKKLKGGSEVLKMRPLKLDLDETKSGSKSKLGWLSIFKKKATTPPPQPTQPQQQQQQQRKPVNRASSGRGASRPAATVPKRHHTFAVQPPRIIVQVM